MLFYSGFALKEESDFFDKYLKKGQYNVAGFSYGAIKALKHTLTCKDRIDTLQLFSPAFFQDRPEKFKRLQLLAYGKNKEKYLHNFMQNCFAPYPQQSFLQAPSTQEELFELLHFRWDKKELEVVASKGVELEVYVGEKDCIIDAQKTKEFFLPFATTYFIKDANHFLQTI